MAGGKNFISALLVGTASVSLIVAGTTVPAIAQAATGSYKIESQPLAQGLMQLSRQANVDIVAPAKITRGRLGKAVSAPTVDAALRQMLAGTGLTYKLAGKRYVIQPSSGERPTVQSNSASSTPAASMRASATGRAAVEGSVVDIASSTALRGALVEIVELGVTTSTDEFGKYRFSGIKEGNYRIRVSYLGYREEELAVEIGGAGVGVDFRLTGGNSNRDIIVYGQRSARAQALNQERTAENVSTVISSDQLGDFQGTTLSESLRKVAGVAFERDPNTGDGTNIIVRGLAPDFNTVKVNGIELPEGSGRGRSASLSNILTESVGNVKISKTLLPNQDSTGTGGLIEIETKTPFDRGRRYASFSVEGAHRAKGFNDEFLAAGTISATFGGEDQFGLSASVQYRDRSIKRVNYESSMGYPFYLPLAPDGSLSLTDPIYVDPRLDFPFESNANAIYPTNLLVNRGETKTENFAVSLSAAVRPFEGTQLFFDFQRFEQNDSAYQLSSNYSPTTTYSNRPIGSLGGERRYSLRWLFNFFSSFPSYSYTPESKSTTNIFTARGESKIGALSVNYAAGYTEGKRSSDRYELQVSRQFDSMGDDMLLPSAFDPVEGRVITSFAPRLPGDDSFPFPLLNESGFAYLNNPNGYIFDIANQLFEDGKNSRYTGNISARYDFSSKYVKYIDIGASYEHSRFEGGSGIRPGISYYPNGFYTAGDVGLPFGEASLGDVGVSRSINVIGREDLISFFNQLSQAPSFADRTPADLIYSQPQSFDPRLAQVFTSEEEFAAYIQGRVDIGKLEVIGGGRLSHVVVSARNLTGPRITLANGVQDTDFFNANSGLISERVSQTEFLPRILANFRFSENLVARAGYYLSVARPQIFLMSTSVVANLDLRPQGGPNNLPQLSVTKGNPDLAPSRTHSFDVSVEHYSDTIGVIKLGAFYKRIDNFLENNISGGIGALADALQILPEDPRFQDVINNPSNYFIQVSIPTNNDKPANIWGIEASLERRFTFLPGALSGLGVFANYTYSKSSKTQPVTWNFSPVVDSTGAVTGFETVELEIPNVPFTGQAPHSGTAALTYNKYGLDASVGYTWQSRRMVGFRNFGMSAYEEAYGTLDARLEYQFKIAGGNFRVFAEGFDLLRGPHDPGIRTSIGPDSSEVGKYFTGGRYFGGRQVRLGLSANF